MELLSGLMNVFQDNEQEAPFECRHCHRQFAVEYYTCPHCGSFSVESRSATINDQE